jgi:protein involved in sex pheromone biosynthesis
MSKIIRASIIGICLLLSGCVTYLDSPPEETVSGIVIHAETEKPVANVSVRVWSRRKYIPFPGMSIIKSGYTQTDAMGRFKMKIKDIFPIHFQVDGNGNFSQAIVSFEEKDSIKIKLPNDFRIYK